MTNVGMTLVRSWLRIGLAVAVLALGLGSACYTPSVPLPPPLIENMLFEAAPASGQVVLTSKAQPNVGSKRFSVFNLNARVGVIFQSAGDGSFTSPAFTGASGDTVQVYYETSAGDLSDVRCTTLAVGSALVGNACH